MSIVESPSTVSIFDASIATTQDEEPVPLSFPNVLRSSKIADRYAYLREPTELLKRRSSMKKMTRDDNGGKRWIRRKENARFIGNPHIIQASVKDFTLEPPRARTTFPEPLPSYLPRNASAPSIQRPIFDPNSANSGRFSLSLKGMRRDLRRSGGRTRGLVRDVEGEVLDWLVGGTILLPNSQVDDTLDSPGYPIGETGTILEVSRTPLQLIWSVENDGFARYVVHCCARYHKIVSFSKDVSGRRLTYLLRPNVTRPDFNVFAILDTPPVTDLDYSSHHGLDSEAESLSLSEMSLYSGEHDVSQPLSALSEYSDVLQAQELEPQRSTHRQAQPNADADVHGDNGDMNENDESPIESDLSDLLDTLIIGDPPRSIRAPRTLRPVLDAQLLWDRRGSARSASSPSRSPSRRLSRKPWSRISVAAGRASSQSFYDYLFA